MIVTECTFALHFIMYISNESKPDAHRVMRQELLTPAYFCGSLYEPARLAGVAKTIAPWPVLVRWLGAEPCPAAPWAAIPIGTSDGWMTGFIRATTDDVGG